jgi:cytosine/adenosine deaminase-related metal-dependent hydrolase
LLSQHRGPFVDFLSNLGVWDPAGLVSGPEEIVSLLRDAPHTLLAHGNYLHPQLPLPSSATVVYCPRTHAAFGHAAHPWRQLLQRGVRVALGTDSLASNPDLDLLAEARFLHRRHPDVPGHVLLRMATLSGAEALGCSDETGSLTPGKSADLLVVPLPLDDHPDPHTLVLGSEMRVRGVLCRGRWLGGDPSSTAP